MALSSVGRRSVSSQSADAASSPMGGRPSSGSGTGSPASQNVASGSSSCSNNLCSPNGAGSGTPHSNKSSGSACSPFRLGRNISSMLAIVFVGTALLYSAFVLFQLRQLGPIQHGSLHAITDLSSMVDTGETPSFAEDGSGLRDQIPIATPGAGVARLSSAALQHPSPHKESGALRTPSASRGAALSSSFTAVSAAEREALAALSSAKKHASSSGAVSSSSSSSSLSSAPRSKVSYIKGGGYPVYDTLSETADLTSPREAWVLSSKGGGWNPLADRSDFTTLNSQLQDFKLSTEFEAVPLSDRELESHEIMRYLLFYSVESLELPVYRRITSTVSLGAAAASQPEFVRFVHRGDKVLGLHTEQVKKQNAVWLKLGPEEYIPVSSRATGLRGNIVHMRIDMKINSTRLMNSRAFDVIRRDCAWVRDLPSRLSCFRMMHLIAETRRLYKATGMLRVRRIDTQEIVAKPSSHSFDDMLSMIMPYKSEQEICSNIEVWAACTQRPMCTWLYNVSTGVTGCQYDADVIYPVLPKSLPEYNASFDFPTPGATAPGVAIAGPEPAPLQPNERFFVYQPSGGINNQRIQLETALVICKLLNRTCVLPPVAQHTNFFFRYNMHHPRKMVSMQRIFNIPRLSEVVDIRTIPEEHNLLSWIDAVGGTPHITTGTGLTADTSETGWRVVMRDARKLNPAFIWHDADIKKWFGNDDSRFLFFANFSMWRTIDLMMLSPQYNTIKSHLTFTDTLKKEAMDLANKMGGPYNAIHVRRGDKRHEASFEEVARDPNYFGTRFKALLPEVPTMYVASDERNTSYFDPLAEMGFKVVTFRDFDQDRLNSFLGRYPPTMYFDILGILEQLICSYAHRFMGSPYSTFTLYILRMRRGFPILSQTYEDTPQLPAIYDGVDFETVEPSTCNPYDPQRHTRPC